MLSNLLIGLFLLFVAYLVLDKFAPGLLARLAHKARDGARSAWKRLNPPIEKHKLAIEKLVALLRREQAAVAQLDARFEAEKDTLARQGKTMTSAKRGVREGKLSRPDDRAYLTVLAAKLVDAEDAYARQKDLVDRLGSKTEEAHEDLRDTTDILYHRQLELKESEANALLTAAMEFRNQAAEHFGRVRGEANQIDKLVEETEKELSSARDRRSQTGGDLESRQTRRDARAQRIDDILSGPLE